VQPFVATSQPHFSMSISYVLIRMLSTFSYYLVRHGMEGFKGYLITLRRWLLKVSDLRTSIFRISNPRCFSDSTS